MSVLIDQGKDVLRLWAVDGRLAWGGSGGATIKRNTSYMDTMLRFFSSAQLRVSVNDRGELKLAWGQGQDSTYYTDEVCLGAFILSVGRALLLDSSVALFCPQGSGKRGSLSVPA